MRSKLKILDLFSGIGGFSLGLELTGGFETAAFCEIEKYPQEVLRKNFPGVPIYDDIKTLTAGRLVRDGIDRIDIITGGYPCQPFSVAGKQKGEKDDRHLWPSMLEIITQVRPTWVVCENVTGHISLGLDQVLFDLEAQGYSSRTFIVPACSVNAPHRRDRLWIVAHANSNSESDGSEHEKQREGKLGDAAKKDDTNSNSKRSHREEKHQHRETEPHDGEIGDVGQICEVLAGSGDSSNGHSEDVADSNGKHERPRQKPKQSEGDSPRECSSDSGENVADSSEFASGRREVHRELGNKGRETSATWREGLRSENNEAYTNHTEQSGEDVADSGSTRSATRLSGSIKREEGVARKSLDSSNQQGGGQTGNHWAVEPGMGRVADGIPRRVAKLKALGNAVVPQIPMMIGRAILEFENEDKN